MNVTIETPMLTGKEDNAREAINSSSIPDDANGFDVIIDGHWTRAATPFYADELVRIILVDRNARSLVIRTAGKNFNQWFREAGERYNVLDRMRFET